MNKNKRERKPFLIAYLAVEAREDYFDYIPAKWESVLVYATSETDAIKKVMKVYNRPKSKIMCKTIE